jgi:hypothetical protein
LRPMVEWLGEIWRRSRTLFRGERFDRELDEEMGLHRELRERERRVEGGLRGEELHAMQRKFGNALEMRERGRDMWGVNWLEDSARDLRYGLRVLRKNPGYRSERSFLAELSGLGATPEIL